MNRTLNKILLLTALWAICTNIFAECPPSPHDSQPSPSSPPSPEINAKEIILEHIQDSYWWHITNIGEREIVIHLPVIVYSTTRGFHVFSSSRIEHARSYEGFRIAEEGDNAGKIVETNGNGEEVRPVDLSLTKTALALVVSALVMLAIFLSVARRYGRRPKYAVPSGFAGAVEMMVMSVEDDIIRKSIGKDYARYSPYLLTAFFFIFINNLMGLLPVFPGGANVTGNIAVTLVLALCTMAAINLFGNREYWKEIFWPDVPLWMKFPIPLMPVIEFFGVLSKPFALAIRLFANITAGHAVILSFACTIFVTVKMGAAVNAGMTVLSVLLMVMMSFLEILVAYIQAYVFTMLSSVFIGLSRPEHAHKPDKIK
ncbi:MAG: F0F1 ATP synthase subunit A [Tannerella sp.]|jgi:F-type H+-transporting ATPase subunit a|nr:F0F1 ATP synthase subunit A [Tannerella sp.]